MSSAARRVARLEGTVGGGTPVIIWQHVEETQDAAISRWKLENPGKDPNATGLTVYITQWAEQERK